MAGEWRETHLGEVAVIASGKRPSVVLKNPTPTCQVPVVGGGGPSGFTDKALYDGHILITGRVGTLGNLFTPSGPCWPSDNALVIQPRSSRTDAVFLRYALQLVISEAAGMNRGAANPLITQSDLGRLAIAHPPLPDQRAIAHILSTLDDKIELNRRMSRTLEEMARAIYKSWFVDFDPVRAKCRGEPMCSPPIGQAHRPAPTDWHLPQHILDLFPDRLVDSELGEIPEGWGVRTLGELVETIKGRSYKSEELVERSEVALVTLKSFARGGGYRPDGLKPFAGPYKHEQVLKPGEVVVACTDVTQAAEVIGRAAMERRSNLYRELVASLDTLIVRPETSDTTVAFLYSLLRTDAFVEHTYAHVTGTTVLHLAKDAVPSFSFALPPKMLVDVFDGIGSRIFGKIETLELESDTLAALRDALLPKLIRGEIRVKDAERFLKERGL